MTPTPTPTPTMGARLVIDQGMICMAHPENAPSGDYLRSWQMDKGIPNGTPIRIMTEQHFNDLVARAQMAGVA